MILNFYTKLNFLHKIKFFARTKCLKQRLLDALHFSPRAAELAWHRCLLPSATCLVWCLWFILGYRPLVVQWCVKDKKTSLLHCTAPRKVNTGPIRRSCCSSYLTTSRDQAILEDHAQHCHVLPRSMRSNAILKRSQIKKLTMLKRRNEQNH
jgi:hypothetical protein